MYVYIRTRTHACVTALCVFTWMRNMYIYIYIYIRIHMYIYTYIVLASMALLMNSNFLGTWHVLQFAYCSLSSILVTGHLSSCACLVLSVNLMIQRHVRYTACICKKQILYTCKIYSSLYLQKTNTVHLLDVKSWWVCPITTKNHMRWLRMYALQTGIWILSFLIIFVLLSWSRSAAFKLVFSY